MKIGYSRQAQKSLIRFPSNKQIQLINKISLLKSNPFVGKKLKGEWQGFYSLRIWPYRILYGLDKKKNLIKIHKIEHRQGVYN
jgi:addiction module RelE/StbE family toxin